MHGTRANVVSLLCCLVSLVSLLCGCGAAAPASAPAPAAAAIAEKDFRISAPATLPAGTVDLDVDNIGPVAHELVVVRGTKRGLPLRADGITVDEDKIEDRTAGALEPQPEGVHDLQVSLTPGRYVLICNMTGHYRAGMHTQIRVR
jgi:uncharacterized cupredoxin-like copper-binding protein